MTTRLKFFLVATAINLCTAAIGPELSQRITHAHAGRLASLQGEMAAASSVDEVNAISRKVNAVFADWDRQRVKLEWAWVSSLVFSGGLIVVGFLWRRCEP